MKTAEAKSMPFLKSELRYLPLIMASMSLLGCAKQEINGAAHLNPVLTERIYLKKDTDPNNANISNLSKNDINTIQDVLAILQSRLTTGVLPQHILSKYPDLTKKQADSMSDNIELNNGSGIYLNITNDPKYLFTRVYFSTSKQCSNIYKQLITNPSIKVSLVTYKNGNLQPVAACEESTFISISKGDATPINTYNSADFEYLSYLLMSEKSVAIQFDSNGISNSTEKLTKYNAMIEHTRFMSEKPDPNLFVLNKFKYAVDTSKNELYVGGLDFKECKKFEYNAQEFGYSTAGLCSKTRWNMLKLKPT